MMMMMLSGESGRGRVEFRRGLARRSMHCLMLVVSLTVVRRVGDYKLDDARR